MLKLRIWDRHSNSPIYFDICRDSHHDYLVSLNRLLVQPITPNTNDFEIYPLPIETRTWIDLCRKVQKQRVISVIFGALCLESLIYDYATRVFSDTYIKKYLDELNLKAKWIIIPKLVMGKDFPTDGHAFQNLGRLARERNALIHSKSKQMEDPLKFMKRVREEIKTCTLHKEHKTELNPYQTVIDVLSELRKLETGREKKISWQLEEVEEF